MAGRRWLAATVAVILAAGLSGCGTSGRPGAGPTATPSGPATPATPSAGPSATPSATPATPTATTRPPTATPTAVTGPLAGRDWERIPTADRVVALTFDAGANADALASILATLTREHVPATFFLTGDWTSRYPALARSIVAAGHVVGNHSVDHPHFPDLTDAGICWQVGTAAATIRATTGADPRPLFRFPYGERTAHDIALLNSLGYVPVRWTVDSLGWKGTSGGMTAQRVADRVVAAAVPGAVVLMHVGSNPDDGSMLDADALPQVIARLRSAGYRFATLRLLTG